MNNTTMKKYLPLLLMAALMISTQSKADEFRRKIKDGDDDMSEVNGRVRRAGGVLTCGYDTVSKQTYAIGMTFKNIQLSKYQNVDSAWIQFSSGFNSDDSLNMLITISAIPSKDFSSDSFSVTGADKVAGTQWHSRRFFSRLARSKFSRTVNIASLINVATNSDKWQYGSNINIVIQAIPDTVWNEDSTIGFRRHALRMMESRETQTNNVVHWPEFFAYYTPNSVGDRFTPSAAVYPNPARNVVNIEWTQENESTANFELISSNGKISQSTNMRLNVGLNTKNLDVSDVSPGMYILRITDGNMILRKRVIVE